MTRAAIADPLPGARILVIDDDRATAEAMARFLTPFGHDVQIAFGGYQALEVARRQRPDYVLLDLGLPGLDGYQVASRLRQELTEPSSRGTWPRPSRTRSARPPTRPCRGCARRPASRAA